MPAPISDVEPIPYGKSLPIVTWAEQAPFLGKWLATHGNAEPAYCKNSREADIWLLKDEEPRFILKRWHHGTAHHARPAYSFLTAAFTLGLPVPQPVGWGRDQNGAAVLATVFAGFPIERPSIELMDRYARLLVEIHRAPLATLQAVLPPGPTTIEPDTGRAGVERIVSRQLRGYERHKDIAALIDQAKDVAPAPDWRLIHGDFHPGNVVSNGDRLRVLDWTDVSLGDWRHDLAWAGLLLLIYHGPRYRERFLENYRLLSDIPPTSPGSSAPASPAPGPPADLSFFEILAGLRWILLARTAPVPIEEEKLATADTFVRERLSSQQRSILRR